MSISRKHFVALADMLAKQHRNIMADQTLTPLIRNGRFEQWQRTLTDIAEFCEFHNENFDKDKFLKYVQTKTGE